MKKKYFPVSVVFFLTLLLLVTSKIYSQSAIQFDGSNDYITFGTASTLGTSTFTLECWIYKTGAGITTTTGTGGVTAVPIISKGRGEGETPANLNMNYFFGLTAAGILTADFEDKINGGNHPITGTTVLANNVWYHIAATYDGTTWRIFLNGNSEATLAVGSYLPENTSIQHAGLGTAMTSTGTTAGFFAGKIDEARIWNRALSQSEIKTNMSQEITSGTGLLGRWGMNEGTGTSAGNSVAGGPNGTLTNGPVWSTGISFSPELWSLQFNGSSNYVTFGAASGLATRNFTIETWFKKTGTGVSNSTGTGGITIIPLVAKGAPESDGSNVDANYILGINSSTNTIAVDFEEGTGSATPGLNHPISGTTVIQNDVWYHAAATFSSTGEYKLYLNGILENSLSLGTSIWPQGNSTQYSALGTMLKSDGTNSSPSGGYFAGVLDEVRIWNYARTESELTGSINSEITSTQTGLLARWALDEGSSTIVNGSAGTTINGTISGSNYYWVFGSPFNISFTIPSDPTNLTATAGVGNQIQLAWTDGSDNEQGFKIERSTTGAGGPFTILATVPSNTISYYDDNLALNTTYYYRLRAFKGSLYSNYTNTANATTPIEANNGLRLKGVDAYIKVNDDPSLRLQQFTLETWFKKEGNGVYNTTGTGGIVNAIPLISKGAAEAENTAVDINYMLCLTTTNRVAADLEAYPTSQNYPDSGSTIFSNNVWHHAAVTYDGTTMKIYLDGNLEKEKTISLPPGYASTSPVGLGTSLRSDGTTAQGFFDGTMDEVRIWNYARTQTQIRATINSKLSNFQTGLISYWGLDEGTGTTVNGSAGTSLSGTIINSNYQWTAGTPFNLPFAPSSPLLVHPSNGEQNLTTSPTLEVTVSDNNSSSLTVNFYGRVVEPSSTFKLIGLPDTQNYPANLNNGSTAIFSSQTQWIRDNAISQNIVYAAHLGDIVNSGSTEQEWINANTSMSILDPSLTGYPDGIPYGTAMGNHDQIGGTTLYNNYFGLSRFSGRSYYGGHYGSDNNNHYDLFSSNGMDFIVVYIKSEASANEIAWADGIIAANTSRRAILVSHNMLTSGNPAPFSTQGQAIYDAVKDNPNLFLMLCGHSPGEGRRTDTYNGNTIYSLLSDFQNYTNGGNGYLRIMEFNPSADSIKIKTYSTWLDQYETDSSSEFSLAYSMGGQKAPAPFVSIGSVSGIANGGNATLLWSNLQGGRTYEWYATVQDEDGYVTEGPTWSFTTAQSTSSELNLTALIEGLYNGTTMVSDTVTVELRGSASPFNLLESKKVKLDSSGAGSINFTNAVNSTPYYIAVKHRNGIETWSASAQTFSSGALSYDFTTAQSQAYGNNLILKSGKYCIYSGDINQDGLVDSGDLGTIDNDNINYVSGYTNTDVTGDGIVDSGDLGITDNNNSIYAGKVIPTNSPSAKRINKPLKTNNQQ
jgi:hypothetical protein